MPTAAARKPAAKPPPAARKPMHAYRETPIAELIPFAGNPMGHPPAQIDLLCRLITEYGWTNPILIDGKRGIIAGHGRLLAAQKLGLDVVPTIELRGLSDAQKRAYIIADNESARKGVFDQDLLAAMLLDLRMDGFDLGLTGLDDLQLDRLLGPIGGLTDPDDAPEVQAVAVSRLGDVWTLGRHRLVCGDCTDAGVVETAMAGAKPHLMVTDPPYGVGLDPAWRDRAGLNKMGKAGAGGENYMESGATDTEARWDAVWASTPADVFYVWCADRRLVEVHQALSAAELVTRQIIVWDKDGLTRTRQHYWTSHEMCLYGVRDGKTASWIGAAGQSTVWKIPSPKNPVSNSKEQNEPHPAQKPVECMRRPIENNSAPGDAVYDPFCGSGTTIIAAEQTGRTCHAIEISPQYVDVCIRRWQQFTGQPATLDGRPFDAIATERA